MAFSGSQITRLGAYGGSRPLYGSFAGKSAAVPEPEAPAAVAVAPAPEAPAPGVIFWDVTPHRIIYRERTSIVLPEWWTLSRDEVRQRQLVSLALADPSITATRVRRVRHRSFLRCDPMALFATDKIRHRDAASLILDPQRKYIYQGQVDVDRLEVLLSSAHQQEHRRDRALRLLDIL